MAFLDLLDRVFAVKRPHGGFLQRRLPPGVNYLYCFGGITFTLFIILAASGMILSVHYVPSETDAFNSVLKLRESVPGGWTLRSVHRWGAHLMVAMLILHVTRVVFSGAYRPPRQLNWIAGLALFILTLAFGFTGYLLPWDQKAFWATTVGTAMAKTVPVVGETVLVLLRGDLDVGGLTLIRFYALHTLWLPLLTAGCLWAHFHMTKKRGIYGGL